ncbi:MAG: hypothetical protein HQ456_02405 [Polynucleobacter sp.]|nr:hypothetical protein [Polynucleobacter sp.]
MIFRNIYLAVLALFIAHSGVSADTCQFTFKCQGSICERVQPLACSPNASNSAVVITSPPAASTLGAATASNLPVSPFVSGSTEVVKSQDTLQSTPISGVGCAENGSCYGDISSINGMPKTTHVNGYFRRDGTYVRGHYRSSGRR